MEQTFTVIKTSNLNLSKRDLILRQQYDLESGWQKMKSM